MLLLIYIAYKIETIVKNTGAIHIEITFSVPLNIDSQLTKI